MIEDLLEKLGETSANTDNTMVPNKWLTLVQWTDYKRITLLNRTCLAQVKLRKFEINMVWHGRFICDNTVAFSNNSRGRTDAVRRAIENYLTLSGQTNLITNKQLDILL